MTVDYAGVEEVLQNAPIAEVKGADGHGMTYTVTLADGTPAIFKYRGDVSDRHERAAWIVDRALGWNLVPPVELRSAEIDGEVRRWTVSLFVEGAVEAQGGGFDMDTSLRAAAFDYLVLVWDRQVWNWLAVPPTSTLPGEFWRLVFIDHRGSFGEGGLVGSKFYGERRGQEIPPHIIEDIKRFAREMPTELNDLLSIEARAALWGRATELASTGTIPTDPMQPVDLTHRGSRSNQADEQNAVRRQREFANAYPEL